jgi:hypothetical protein
MVYCVKCGMEVNVKTESRRNIIIKKYKCLCNFKEFEHSDIASTEYIEEFACRNERNWVIR